MSTRPLKVLIIDDHQLFADGLGMLLAQLPHALQVCKFNDAEQVLEEPVQLSDADLIIIDLHMPGLSGFAFLEALRGRPNTADVAVISGVESRNEIERALALGAKAFIPKDSTGEIMLEGIAAVLRGERYLPIEWAGKIDWPAEAQRRGRIRGEIGPRQIQVLKLLGEGLQNKQIAMVLGVSVSTVKSHTQQLYRTLHVSNRTACIKAAIDQGLI